MIVYQKLNEFFPEKKGYDVNLFVIENEGLLENDCKFNLIYADGAIHVSNTVSSMLPRVLRSQLL